MTEKSLEKKLPDEFTGKDAWPKNLDFYVRSRHEKGIKRPYIFDFSKAKTCDHPSLKIMSRGGNTYRCPDCNYSFQILGANMWPLHWNIIQDFFQIFHFTKEFGRLALEEVLRTPIGQMDDSPHKPVLPEGMSVLDVIEVLDEIDVTTEDGGMAALEAKIKELWEQPSLRAPQINKELTNGKDQEEDGES